MVVVHNQIDEEHDDAAGTAAGDGVDALMMEVGQEGPWRMEQQNNYACHQTGANMDRHSPCDVAHECGQCYDDSKDDDGGFSMTHHLVSCGLVTCEGVAESPHDRPLVVACVHDACSPAA